MRTRVKVSGLHSAAEVRAVVGAGADAIGCTFEAHAEPGPSEAVAACPPGVTFVLHASRSAPETILTEAREAGTAAVQLPPEVDPVVHMSLRRNAPHLKIIQTVRLDDASAVELATSYARIADAVLLEIPRQVLTVADLGEAQEPRKVDWRRCRDVVKATRAPVWLAGGLTPASVGEAIDQVNPFGVDVGAGVRTAGRLDARRLSAFFHAVRVAKIG